MYASLINYINSQYEQAKLDADTPQEVHSYMKNAYGAVDFFCSLDKSKGVDDKVRKEASRKWKICYYPKFYILMGKKA